MKDNTHPSGWRVDDSGRRPSELMLVPKIREAVDRWRDGGYPGASDVTRELFRYWFEEEHEARGLNGPLRFHFGQREAIETLAWLVEVFAERDAVQLIEKHWTRLSSEVVPVPPQIETTMEGRRKVRWRLARVGDQTQDLPPERLRRYAFRMATGSGKTWVMAMAVVWAHLHRRLVPGSALSANFLIVAPNVIVYERLRKDFEGNRIFGQLPLIPPQWKAAFDQRVILRGEPTEPAESGNLFLTNVQQLYDRSRHWEPKNAVDALLGDDSRIGSGQHAARSILERVASLPDLIVMNDEAHHVHDEDLTWSQSLLDLHKGLPDGLAAWLDFSATPKDQGGLFFPWTVCDYPLQQAVEDRIVKAPVIVTHEDDAGRPPTDPDGVTGANAAEKYRYWLDAAVHCLKRHEMAYGPVGVRPILFVMTEKIAHAKAIASHFKESAAYGLGASEILTIHTDGKGGIRQSDLDALRQAARDVDSPDSGVRVIVSVMMLREGWDVRNVSVVLGLRPFSARAEILPEQVIGRGLRLMQDVTPDRTQTLEVLGTTRLLETCAANWRRRASAFRCRRPRHRLRSSSSRSAKSRPTTSGCRRSGGVSSTSSGESPGWTWVRWIRSSRTGSCRRRPGCAFRWSSQLPRPRFIRRMPSLQNRRRRQRFSWTSRRGWVNGPGSRAISRTCIPWSGSTRPRAVSERGWISTNDGSATPCPGPT